MKLKLKTHKGASKRFRCTGSGKVRFRRANRAHIRTKQSAKQVRQGRCNGCLFKTDGKMVLRMLVAR